MHELKDLMKKLFERIIQSTDHSNSIQSKDPLFPSLVYNSDPHNHDLSSSSLMCDVLMVAVSLGQCFVSTCFMHTSQAVPISKLGNIIHFTVLSTTDSSLFFLTGRISILMYIYD